MRKEYYTVNWTKKQSEFIKDNLQYLNISDICTTTRLDAYTMIIINKFMVEHDIYLNYDNYDIYLKFHHFTYCNNKLKLINIVNITYEKLEDAYNSALKQIGITEKQLHIYQKLEFIYDDVYPEEIILDESKSKMIFKLMTNTTYIQSIGYLLLYMQSGKVPEDLSEVNKLLTDIDRQTTRKGHIADKFEYNSYTIKTYINGKIEVVGLNDNAIKNFNEFKIITDKIISILETK